MQSLKPLVIGHRGAAALLPENTLESIELAFHELHAGAVEFDVRFSRDKIPVIIHDATLERTTNGHGYAAHQDFKNLQKLNAGQGFRIPSLEEVLILFKGKTLAVEIKDKSAELVHAVMSLVQQYKSERQCIVGSRHHLIAETLQKNYPGQSRFLSQREIVQNYIAWQSTQVKPENQHPGMPLTASMPLEACGMHFDNPDFINYLHQKGIAVFFWTINDPGEIKRLASSGADGIITDNPGTAAD